MPQKPSRKVNVSPEKLDGVWPAAYIASAGNLVIVSNAIGFIEEFVSVDGRTGWRQARIIVSTTKFTVVSKAAYVFPSSGNTFIWAIRDLSMSQRQIPNHSRKSRCVRADERQGLLAQKILMSLLSKKHVLKIPLNEFL